MFKLLVILIGIVFLATVYSFRGEISLRMGFPSREETVFTENFELKIDNLSGEKRSIKLEEITDFEWDKLYMIASTESADEILNFPKAIWEPEDAETIRKSRSFSLAFDEAMMLYIFVQDDRVVYSADFATDPMGLYYQGERQNLLPLTPQSPEFDIKSKEGFLKRNYLVPIYPEQ